MTHLALEMELLPRPGSPRTARRAVRDALGGVEQQMREDAELLASELVGNAVHHAGGRTTIIVRVQLLAPSGVRLEVTDGAAAPPELHAAADGARAGRGLGVVDAVADAWGADPHPRGGKTVWCELGTGARQSDPT